MPLSWFDLPGFTLPLNFAPHAAYNVTKYEKDRTKTIIEQPAQGEGRDLFPTALNDAHIEDGDCALPLTTLREMTMVRLMDNITDKKDWDIKMFTQRSSTMKFQTNGKPRLLRRPIDVTQKMVDWVIAELRYKAERYKQTGHISIYNGDVVKSDSAVPQQLREALKKAAWPLEDVPERYKDWHPGSDDKVLDLVHPSLYPLMYGKSRILRDQIVTLDDCLKQAGTGEIIPVPPESEAALDWKKRHDFQGYTYHHGDNKTPYSLKFQWLPCNVAFVRSRDPTSTGPVCKITSYINNLHPQHHKDLYRVIEQVLDCAIPLWNTTISTLNSPKARDKTRIEYKECTYDPDPATIPEDQKPQKGEDENEEDWWDRLDAWERSIRNVVIPEPGEFTPPQPPEKPVDLIKDYRERGLQVIVKLANIHLTPEKPSYDGGSWHVEGAMNEHICATALYYYDSDNITESRLAFRHLTSMEATVDIMYEQDHHDWLPLVFGGEQDEAAIQEVGSIATTSGRLITFPNILQHQVQPFRLADPTRPGHRKLLALFLVDPNIRVISTANVPPQQHDWWSEKLRMNQVFSKDLPPELREQVFKSVDDWPMQLDEAKKVREELMDERKVFVQNAKGSFESIQFSLCEH